MCKKRQLVLARTNSPGGCKIYLKPDLITRSFELSSLWRTETHSDGVLLTISALYSCFLRRLFFFFIQARQNADLALAAFVLDLARRILNFREFPLFRLIRRRREIQFHRQRVIIPYN